MYYSGDISEYASDENCVCYKDAYSGITYIYTPPEDGLESSGKTFPKIMYLAPFANAKENPISAKLYGYTIDLLTEELDYTATTFADDNVVPEVFTYIKPNQIFLWNGHGGFNRLLSKPYLETGMIKDIGHYTANFTDYLSGKLGLGNERVYVTPGYIDKHCGDMTGSLIWIGSCHSAQTDALANGFLNHGASVYVGYSDSVMTRYDTFITNGTFDALVDGIKNKNKSYTIAEALNLAMDQYGNDDSVYRIGTEYADKNPAHPVIYGDSNYKLEVPDRFVTTPTPTTVPTDTPSPIPTLTPTQVISNFNINGTWKSIGTYGFGQAQPGVIVAFDGTHCNFYSPYDTYSSYTLCPPVLSPPSISMY